MLRHERFDSTDTSSVRMIAMGGGPVDRRPGARGPGALRRARRRPLHLHRGRGRAWVPPPTTPPRTPRRAWGGPARASSSPSAPTTTPCLAAGELGHVCLRSPAVMRGYWRDPEATAAVFTADGAVRTGDLGFVDERGRLHLSGRSKEMYVRGGYNVYPLEVENVLADHPGVAHVAVIPRPDPVMGEIGVAVVVPRHGGAAPTLETLRDHARGRLAAYKLPEAIIVADELPRTAMEKIDRTALGALVVAAAR